MKTMVRFFFFLKVNVNFLNIIPGFIRVKMVGKNSQRSSYTIFCFYNYYEAADLFTPCLFFKCLLTELVILSALNTIDVVGHVRIRGQTWTD